MLAVDLRGRGLSEYDSDPANYSLPVELGDVVAVLTALEAEPAIFVGTSRGGILTMLLAALRPAAIAGAVLNDIGPVIENKGVMRIKGYVGKLPQPRSIEEGAEILRRLSGAQFTRFTPDDWIDEARRIWRTKDGKLVPVLRPGFVEDARRVRSRTAPARALGAIRCAPGRAVDGHPRRAFRFAVGRNGRGDEGAAARISQSSRSQGEGHAPRLEGSVIDDIAAFAERCDRAG